MTELRTQNHKGYKYLMTYIPKDSTVLDLACGCGNPFAGIKFPTLIGVDIWKKHFNMPEYDNVLHYDIRKINEIFQEKCFDVVTAFDVIEHLEKEEGFKLIKDAERIARKKVIFFTPKKWDDNKKAVETKHYWSYGNPANYHKSLWKEKDFTDLGYKTLSYRGYVFVEKVIEK